MNSSENPSIIVLLISNALNPSFEKAICIAVSGKDDVLIPLLIGAVASHSLAISTLTTSSSMKQVSVKPPYPKCNNPCRSLNSKSLVFFIPYTPNSDQPQPLTDFSIIFLTNFNALPNTAITCQINGC